MGARRLAPAFAAALLLAACSVDVEGAPCSVPFPMDPGSASTLLARAECPDGQACGWDRRCSARAYACAVDPAAHCDPEDRTQDACVEGNARSRYCTGADPVCGTWVTEDCSGRGMACGLRGSGRCECPDPQPGTTTLVADAMRGSPDAGRRPFPRGLAEPPECRYGSLFDALHAATATFTPITVSAMDGVYVETTARLPLTVGGNVTLAAAEATRPATLRGNPDAEVLVRVEGFVNGLRVEGGGSTGVGVLLKCSPRPPEVRNLTVNGGGGAARLDWGILVGGNVFPGASCGGRVVAAAVTGADTGLSLEPETWGTATVLGGSFGGNRTGIRMRRGTMTVEPDPATSTVPVRVAGNSGEGVLLENAFLAGVLDATLRGADVTGNGGTGIAASGNVFPAAAKVRIRESDVHGNARTAQTGAAGGIHLPALATTMSLLELSGTRVWSNGGDQVAVAGSANVRSLGTAACGPTSNWIGCAGAGASIANLGQSWLDVYGTIFSGVSGNVLAAGPNCTGGEPGFPAAPTCE